MGDLITRLGEPDHHKVFSRHASVFASDVGNLASKHHGALVFSGGDDVLAFLPVDTALDFADEVNERFRRAMRELAQELQRDHRIFLDALPTMSTGVVFGHYSEHLQRMKEWAGKAESDAKSAGRNRLLVAYYPRGASTAAATSHHSWDDTPVRNVWHQWIAWHRDGRLPDGAAYELRELSRELAPLAGDLSPGTLGSERDRILQRKRGIGGNRPLTTAELGELGARSGATPESLARLADELIISGKIATIVDVANGPVTTFASETSEETP
jgi:CRISPR-associated protein Cmr2